MKIVDKYILANVFLGFLAAAALLLPLFSTLDLVGELDDVSEEGYRLAQALQVVMMTVPRRAVELGPFIALLGGIVALGQLSLTQELSVLRAAGISATRIAFTTLMAGLVLALALGAVDEFLASPLQQKALQIRAKAIAMTEKGSSKESSIWARKDGQVARIGGLRQGRPSQIEIFSFDDQDHLQEYIVAEYADIQPEGVWQLYNVRLKRWVNDEEESIQQLDQLPWHAILPSTRLDEVSLPPESFSAQQLRRYVLFLQDTGQPATQYEMAFWQKLGVPILTLAMILFSVPFTFGQARSAGLGGKLALGSVVGLLIYVTNQILVNLGLLFKLNALLVGVLPALVMLAIAIVIVCRFDRSSR